MLVCFQYEFPKLHNIFSFNLIGTNINTKFIVTNIIPTREKHVIGFGNI